MTHLDRRTFLTGAMAAGTTGVAFPAPAVAQGKPSKLTIVCHRVHRTSATEGPGGDITAEWRAKNGVELEWVTLDLTAIHDRIFREAGLKSTEMGLSFVLNARAVPDIMGLFEPFDALQAATPVEDIADISQGMLDTYRSGGRLYGIPYRQAVNAFHYNELFFKERGLAGPPVVIDDFLEATRKLTYSRSDGLRVHGWGFQADNYSDTVRLARAYGGDLITEDFKCVADGPGMVKALQLQRDMYAAGLIPRNITAMKQSEVITAMQTGQIAMSVFPFGRTVLFNDPKQSKFAGNFRLSLPLVSKEMQARGEVLSTAEFWGMMIPRNYPHKELAWSLIRLLVGKEAMVRSALNGNGPVRVSTYTDPRVIQDLPYAADEAKALRYARVPMPAFSKAAEAKDVFVEEMQASMLGFKSSEEAGKDMARRIRPLLPG
jgi:multiple sugar transport system substrate-binding protein